MTKKPYPSDKLDQYIVRFPDGMRQDLKDEAARNGRSLNAEIIHRLSQYRPLMEEVQFFTRDLKHVELAAVRVRDQLAAARLELDATKQALHSARARAPDATLMPAPIEKVVYVVLDANGQPVGWSELMAHLEGLVQAAGGTFDRVEAAMINSKNPQGVDADGKAAWVLERYRQGLFGWQADGVKPEKAKDGE